ncbi:MFS transporter [Sciscionella marina]|uniref:MFS transporter n=1 Tax=Sciscionella marina TaxID=508770 RepID=UPI0003653C5C|nr:MFS transporter [Sciscionella marina]
MTHTGTGGQSTRHPGTGFVVAYIATLFACYLAIITPANLTVALRIGQIDPQGKVGGLALALGLGALCAVIANPVFGQLSDRTASRFGMRKPWLVIGVLAGTAGLIMVAFASTVAIVVLGWCITQTFYNATLTAVVALLPDQIPARRRGLVSGLMGICFPVSLVLGSFVAQAVSTLPPFWMFVLPALPAPVTVLVLCVVLRDRRLAKENRAPLTLRDLTRTFAVRPRRNPDFAWACLVIFLLSIGTGTLSTYLVYFLSDGLGIAAAEVPHVAFLVNLITYGLAVPTSLLAGWLNDRIGGRKQTMVFAGLLLAIGLFTIVALRSMPGLYLGAAITGLGCGGYYCGHFGLPAELLSADDEAAREMGVVNIALTLPSSLVPLYGPLLLAVASPEGTNYSMLFACGIAPCLLAILAVGRIRRLRDRPETGAANGASTELSPESQ